MPLRSDKRCETAVELINRGALAWGQTISDDKLNDKSEQPHDALAVPRAAFAH